MRKLNKNVPHFNSLSHTPPPAPPRSKKSLPRFSKDLAPFAAAAVLLPLSMSSLSEVRVYPGGGVRGLLDGLWTTNINENYACIRFEFPIKPYIFRYKPYT